MPSRPEPSSESERLYPALSADQRARVDEEVREFLVQKKVREERLARECRRRAGLEDPLWKPPER